MKGIPTPPTSGSDGGVKGKLADFFLDYQHLGAPTQGGAWDSDACYFRSARSIRVAERASVCIMEERKRKRRRWEIVPLEKF